jgi:V/A-type H+/Na+-transporting ATPase subunit E
MSLTDIENRIITDAEKEAEDILVQAKAERKKRLAVVSAELSREHKQFQDILSKQENRTVEQNKQLLLMNSAQKVLQSKREHLENIYKETLQEILSEEKTRSAFFKKILAKVLPQVSGENKLHLETGPANKDLVKGLSELFPVKPEVTIHKEWSPGKLEIVLSRARIDCSIEQSFTEQKRDLENDIAKLLFG